MTQSQKTKLLDLGSWVAIQHQVEAFHRILFIQKDECAKTGAFMTISPKILESTLQRWKMVLHLVCAGKGKMKFLMSIVANKIGIY